MELSSHHNLNHDKWSYPFITNNLNNHDKWSYPLITNNLNNHDKWSYPLIKHRADEVVK